MNAHAQPPKDGSNSALTDEDRKVLLLQHVGKIIDLDEQIAELREKRKTARRLAKTDGFDLGTEIDLAVKISKADDDETIAANLAKQLRIASYFQLPVSFQMNLFDQASTDALDRIMEEGARAGYLAKERKSPYADGSEEDQVWLRGYDGSQERARDVWQRAAEQRNAGSDNGAGSTVVTGEAAAKKRGRKKAEAPAGDEDAFSADA